MKTKFDNISRRRTLGMLGVGVVAAATALPARFAIGGKAKVRIGTLLPYSGTYTRLGQSITNAMELAFAQAGG